MFDAGGYHPGTWLPAGLVLAGLLVRGGARRRPTRSRRAATGPHRPAAAGRVHRLVLRLPAVERRARAGLGGGEPAAGRRAGRVDARAGAVADAHRAGARPPAGLRRRGRRLPGRAAVGAVGLRPHEPLRGLPLLAAAGLSQQHRGLRVHGGDPGAPARGPGPTRRSRPRPLAQGLATFLCAFALLPQSRGSILGGARRRWPLLRRGGPFRWRLLLHVRPARRPPWPSRPGRSATSTPPRRRPARASGALRDAFTAILRRHHRRRRLLGAAAGARRATADVEARVEARAAGGAQLFGAAAAVALVARGRRRKGRRRSPTPCRTSGSALTNPGVRTSAAIGPTRAASRLTSTDPLERYDYWRVALDGLRRQPDRRHGRRAASSSAMRSSAATPSRRATRTTWCMKVLGDTGPRRRSVC